jgi:hypothetical protein
VEPALWEVKAYQIRLLDEPWYEDSVEKKGAGGVAFLSVV